MRAKILILGLVCLLIFVSTFAQEKSKEQTSLQIYVQRAIKIPLTFKVSREKEEEVWGRIQSFIAKYSSMKIQIATDYVIETYNPTKTDEYDPKFGYKAIKTFIEDKVEFKVECFAGESGLNSNAGNKYNEFKADHNAHILACYALTGKIEEKAVMK